MKDYKSAITSKIDNRSMVFAVFGVGYVGVPLAQAIAKSGFKVIGFDIDEDRVNKLNSSISPIKQIKDEEIGEMILKGFEATTDFSRTLDCDFLIVCVPTPLGLHREPDLTAIRSTMQSIQPYLKPGQALALESTTWPGTTNEVLKPYIVDCGLSIGEDFFLIYSPEREDPGNADYDTKSMPKILAGTTKECSEVGAAAYQKIVNCIVPVSSTQTAEMVKLVENIHRSVNIGLVNELKKICDAMAIDIFDVIDAAATKPFGFTPYYPGPGIGGHCIPIDPFYLTWKAREYGVNTRFIELAGEINAEMPKYVVDKLASGLNARGKALSKCSVLCVGIAYKRDVDDMRESPSVEVMELLKASGAHVEYSDPNVPKFPKMRTHRFDLVSVELTAENIESFDALVLLTDHTDLDYELVLKHAALIVDTRGKYRTSSDSDDIYRANVVRA